MSAEQNRQKDLVDTTDCLEAVGVFRCWKNLFFIVVLFGLLLLGLCFWVMDLGLIKPDSQAADEQLLTEESVEEQVVLGSSDIEQAEAVMEQEVDEVKQQIDAAAAKVSGDVNAPTDQGKAKMRKPVKLPLKLRPVHVMWSIRALDAVIILGAILYCLTILLTLKISLLGRLGGINHISRAMFLSLIMLVLIIPWQVALGWGLFGVTFEPNELVRRINEYDSAAIFVKGLYWFRYVVVWVIALLCLLLAQIRTARWSKATLRRLEVI